MKAFLVLFLDRLEKWSYIFGLTVLTLYVAPHLT